MTARRLIAPAPALRYCMKCGRELVCFVTVVREPGPENPHVRELPEAVVEPLLRVPGRA